MSTAKIKATEPQAQFLSMECKYPAFVAGFGTGKSHIMCLSALIDGSHSPNALIGIYEPTYNLVRTIAAPRMQSLLTEIGITYKYNKSDKVIYTSSSGMGDFMFNTLDNPEMIIGYETYRSHVDELDTLKPDKAREAWNKIIARNRQKPIGIEEPFNRVSAYTTPEGFRFTHDRWVVNGGGNYCMIQASTLSNPFLPDDYVDSLRDSYPGELIDAYIDGKFVNLTSGTVFNLFNRKTCHSDEEIKPNEPLLIGMDFNVTNMSAVIYNRNWVAVDELNGIYDTPTMIQTIKDKFIGHNIIVYPDASGQNRSTKGASVSDISLLQGAGFEVRVKSTNPRVKDRIISSNAAFDKGKVKVNTAKCPEFTRCLEQLSYDKNGDPDKSSGFDHLTDAGTYPIAYEMPVVKPIVDIPISIAY